MDLSDTEDRLRRELLSLVDCCDDDDGTSDGASEGTSDGSSNGTSYCDSSSAASSYVDSEEDDVFPSDKSEQKASPFAPASDEGENKG